MMPRPVIPMLAGCALALTACAAWISREPPPEVIAAPCASVVVLPQRALTQAEVETLWRSDRHALTDCGERHALVVSWAGG